MRAAVKKRATLIKDIQRTMMDIVKDRCAEMRRMARLGVEEGPDQVGDERQRREEEEE